MSAIPAVYQVLERLLAREIPAREFERWVYDSPELERVLGADEYFRLLELDYGLPDAAYELRKIVEGIYERRRPGMLVPDRVWRLACGLARDAVPFRETVRTLAGLWYAGHEWIPIEFVGIASELDDIPDSGQYPLWDARALVLKRAEWEPRLESLQRASVEAARELLKQKYPDAPCA